MLIVFIRVLIIYVLIIFSLRLMGKRQIGQLQPSELVVTILVSNIATMSIEDTNVPLIGGMIPILALVSFDILISALSLKSKRARRIISGTPRILIQDGKLNQAEMHELRFTIDDVMSQLRAASVFDIQDVQFAIVETTGVLSVYQKYDARPITPKTMQMPTPDTPDAPPVVMVSDGAVIDSAFPYCNLRPEWLSKLLEEKGLHTSDIFLMTCDRQANYLLIKKDPNRRQKEKANRQKEDELI